MIFTKDNEKHFLNTKCKPVEDIETQVMPYAKRALYDLSKSTGVAIAANQIGVPYRWYMDIREIIYINPVILEKSEPHFILEGCLSLPGFETMKYRYDKITLEFTDVLGKKHILKQEGLDAQIAQHEIYHLSGHLIDEDDPKEVQALTEWLNNLNKGETNG